MKINEAIGQLRKIDADGGGKRTVFAHGGCSVVTNAAPSQFSGLYEGYGLVVILKCEDVVFGDTTDETGELPMLSIPDGAYTVREVMDVLLAIEAVGGGDLEILDGCGAGEVYEVVLAGGDSVALEFSED